MSRNTKRTLKVLSAVALSTLIAGGVYAASGGCGGADGFGSPGSGYQRGHGHGRGGDMAEMAGERLAAAKDQLGITEEQEAAWNGFAETVEEQAKSMQTQREQHRAARKENTSNPLSAEQRIDALQARADGLQQMADAARTLYDGLTTEQKAAADELLAERWGRRR